MTKRKNRWMAAIAGALACLALAGATLPAVASADEATQSEVQGVVNLNTATAEELQRLPGVGPAKSEAIVAARERHGGFEHVRQIIHVRGIGRATYRKLQPMLVLEGETTLE